VQSHHHHWRKKEQQLSIQASAITDPGAKLRCRKAYRGSSQLCEAFSNAIAHDDQAQMGQRVLVKEFADEALQDSCHDSQTVGAHVTYRGCSREVHDDLHQDNAPAQSLAW